MFEEGHYRQVEGAGLLKGASNPEGAREFLEFLLSDEAQRTLASTNIMFPVIPETELPGGFDAAVKPGKVLALPSDLIDRESEDWIRSWSEGFGKK